MKKFYKFLSMFVLVLVVLSVFTIGIFAAEETPVAEECSHEFRFDVEAKDLSSHYGKCSGCGKVVEAPHFMTSDGYCGGCGYGCDHPDFSEVFYSGDNGHSGYCKKCGINVWAEHNMTSFVYVDSENHVGKCKVEKCSYELLAAHEDADQDGRCDDCGYISFDTISLERVIGAALGCVLLVGILYFGLSVFKRRKKR